MSAPDSHRLPRRQHVRSYVRRDGRITKAQQHAIATLWGRYGIALEAGHILDFSAVFARQAPVWLEVGFGNGEALVAMAVDMPEVDFLGVDVYRPGIGHLLRLIAANELHNIRVVHADAMLLFEQHLRPRSLDRVLLFFPDPWPKKRHHKRRLLRTDFAPLLARALRSGGLFHMATDWEDYARYALEVMNHERGFTNLADGNGFVERPSYRPMTKFEQRGKRLGHGVWDLLYRRL